MRVHHWVAMLAGGALLTATAAAAVFGAQKSAEPEDLRTAAVKNAPSPPLVRESQVRQPPAAAPSAPQRIETIKYDSWVVVCHDSVGGTAKKTCIASLRVGSQGQQQQLLLTWQIGLNKDGHFVTAFQVPTGLAIKQDDRMVGGGILIQSGLELKFGNGQTRRLNYVSCNQQQCFAEALIDDAFVKEALANSMATVTVRTAGGATIPFEFAIKGIDKAISATRK